MPRTPSLVLSASLVGLGLMAAWGRAAQPAKPTPTPTPTPKASSAPVAKGTPRVFTNDDLEEAKKKGGPVQDLKATGGEPYEPPPPLADPQPAASPTPEVDPQAERIAYLESQIKNLDDAAKTLLWGYLQSTDSNEILSLKAQQQEILNQIDALKAELAQLRGEATGRPAATTPTPTPQPG